MIKLKQGITFNAGTVTNDNPSKTTHLDPYVIDIAMGKDATATLIIPKDAVDNNPELFEKLK